VQALFEVISSGSAYPASPELLLGSRLQAASHGRWLAASENQDYFRSPLHVDRVKAWRSRHPDYWRTGQSARTALQDVIITQPIGSASKTFKIVLPPLQEVIAAKPAVLIGLIAHIVGTPLQDETYARQSVCYDWAAIFSPLTQSAGRDRLPDALQDPRCHHRQGIAQTARALGLDPKTVATWLARNRFERRRSVKRGSILDPIKGGITRLLDAHPYSAQQIFQKLREEGYRGGATIVRNYVSHIRPTKLPVYLKLHFAPAEAWQARTHPHLAAPRRCIRRGDVVPLS
jgi:hypothetical protein